MVRAKSLSPQLSIPRETQATTHRHLQGTTPRRTHVLRRTSSETSHAPHSKHHPTQETRIFAAEETQPRKERILSKNLLYEKKEEIYDRIDTPLLFIGQAVNELGVNTYNIAARPEVAEPLYDEVVRALEEQLGRPIGTGRFGADMQVSLTNDGPVTIWIDSKARE